MKKIKKSMAGIRKMCGVNKKYGAGRDEIVRGAKNIFAPFTVLLHARSAGGSKGNGVGTYILYV